MRLAPLHVATRAPCELVDLTDAVRASLRGAGVDSGLLVAYCPHTTAGLTIQENADPDVQRDLLLALENAVPQAPPRGRYHHAEGNSAAHAKASLTGASATLLVDAGELVLGTWQALYLCEFDGPRTRTVELKVIPG